VGPADRGALTHLAATLCELPLLRKYQLGEDALAKRLLRALDEQDGLLTARLEADGEPVGLAWFLARGAFATGSYLRLLLVAPKGAGLGVGSALLRGYEWACDRPAGGFFALTDEANGQARQFYNRHGYQEVGLLPQFVRKDCTELLVWRPLLTPR
jgi:GNAT superfamily N-acetyltransferase